MLHFLLFFARNKYAHVEPPQVCGKKARECAR